MSELKSILLEKQREADEMLEIINVFSATPKSVVKVSMMKSAQILLLYNAVESITYLSFERIHEKVSRSTYRDLNVKLKGIWAEYYFSSFSAKEHSTHLRNTLDNSLRLPALEIFIKKIKLFSGNLDARRINLLLNKYGVIPISCSEMKRLKYVKDKRNSLAHGEYMFKEACREITESELKDLTLSVFKALENLVRNIEFYVDNKKFLELP